MTIDTLICVDHAEPVRDPAWRGWSCSRCGEKLGTDLQAAMLIGTGSSYGHYREVMDLLADWDETPEYQRRHNARVVARDFIPHEDNETHAKAIMMYWRASRDQPRR